MAQEFIQGIIETASFCTTHDIKSLSWSSSKNGGWNPLKDHSFMSVRLMITIGWVLVGTVIWNTYILTSPHSLNIATWWLGFKGECGKKKKKAILPIVT